MSGVCVYGGEAVKDDVGFGMLMMPGCLVRGVSGWGA